VNIADPEKTTLRDIFTPSSSWQTYAASVAAGAIGGAFGPYYGKFVNAIIQPAIKQFLEVESGAEPGYDPKEMGIDIMIRLGTSFFLPGEGGEIEILRNPIARAIIQIIRKITGK